MPDDGEATATLADRPQSVGMVGAGQLARMTAEASSALGITFVVLAEHPDDAAVAVSAEVVFGSPTTAGRLGQLASACDVVTFDHELVDLDLVARIEAEGHPVRPSSKALRFAVDKAEMRARFAAAGIPVPAHTTVGTGAPETRAGAIGAFAEDHGWPVVVKAARGGYDGRGVWPVRDPGEALEVCRTATDTVLVVEEMVPLDAELAVLVARRPAGEVVTWPAVETAQVDGVCREVLVPGRLATDLAPLAAEAELLARRVAEVVGSVGVLAVELFASAGRLLVNEVATRPHNTGHWTIEGATTSQFENHLRAVLDLPLGDPTPVAAHVASVNVFGAEDGRPPGDGLAAALDVLGAHVHLYGKAARPGRKLGHVTVCGDDASDVRARAWEAAQALGTPVPTFLAAPRGTR